MQNRKTVDTQNTVIINQVKQIFETRDGKRNMIIVGHESLPSILHYENDSGITKAISIEDRRILFGSGVSSDLFSGLINDDMDVEKRKVPTYQVIRFGQTLDVMSEEIVCGDCVFLMTGNVVPFDGIMMSDGEIGDDAEFDESAATGEPELIRIPKYGRILAGSRVKYGVCRCIALIVGLNTEMGMILSQLERYDHDHDATQQKKCVLM